MDDFFSKYGWVVATGVIIVIVISMMTPVGQLIQTSIESIIGNFCNNVNEALTNATWPGLGA